MNFTDRLDKLSPEKRRLFELLREQKKTGRSETPGIGKAPRAIAGAGKENE